MQKRMKIMLMITGAVLGVIFLYKIVVMLIFKHMMSKQSHAVTVSVMKVDYSTWQSHLFASGSIRAVRGVNVTTEVPGIVQEILFTSGAWVKQGDLLVQMRSDTDVALLHSIEANAELAKITYERDKKQLAIHAISQQALDSDLAQLKTVNAQVAQQATVVAKKSIRAPFDGRLGVNEVDPGQYLSPGDKIVNLQNLNPLYVDFFVPQQELARLKVDQDVRVTCTTYPNNVFLGHIVTIEPAVDNATRNVKVEALIDNQKNTLAPGMFVSVEVMLDKAQQFLTVPQTAITFNPYGNVVFIVHDSKKKPEDKPLLTVAQHFVTTGETRGDQIVVLNGLKVGDEIVSSGQLKLKNGTQIEVNNSIVPPNNPNPTLDNNH